MLNTEIKASDRVSVKVFRKGYHQRVFKGTFICWTPSGLAKVLEDGEKQPKNHAADNVKKIK